MANAYTYKELFNRPIAERKAYIEQFIDEFNANGSMLYRFLRAPDMPTYAAILASVQPIIFKEPSEDDKKRYRNFMDEVNKQKQNPDALYSELCDVIFHPSNFTDKAIGMVDESSPVDYIRSKLFILAQEFMALPAYEDVVYICENMDKRSHVDARCEKILLRSWGEL